MNAFNYKGEPGFPGLIQAHLRADGLPVRVINAGLPGNDTRLFAAKVLLDLHRYRPDVVIVNSIWNDLKWITRANDSTLFLLTPPQAVQKNPILQEMNLTDRILGFSSIYRKARDWYWRKKLNLGDGKRITEGILTAPGPARTDPSAGLDQYRINLVGTVEVIRAIGAIPVLAIEERLVHASNPEEEKRRISYHMVNVASHEELVTLFGKCDSIITQVAAELNVPLISLNEPMGGDPRFFTDHVHTTREGSRLIARAYADFLKPMITSKQPGATRPGTTQPGAAAASRNRI